MQLDAFAADRRERLTVGDDALRPAVEEGLQAYIAGDAEWMDPIVTQASQIWLENYAAEAPDASYRAARARFEQRVRESLEQTTEPDVVTAGQTDRITRWLSTYAINAGTTQGAYRRGVRYKLWVDMEDDAVRESHRRAAGQVVPVGGRFDVGGTKMAYPGEPVGPISEWINCRCVAMPAARSGETMSNSTYDLGSNAHTRSIVAAAGGDRSGALVVLLPAEDDPITAATSEDQAHMTTIWFGDIDELGADREELEQAVRLYAQDLDGPVVVPVKERGLLGDDDADVVFLEPTDSLLALRDGMLVNEPIRQAYDAAEQYPEWTPHVTLGYPEGVEGGPAIAEYDGDEVTFDRVGLWLGGDYTEYPMGGTVSTVTADAAAAIADVEEEVVPVDEEEDDDGSEDLVEIPVHGVLAPEGVETGDGRGFREGAISSRPLPYPLRLEILGSHGGNNTSEVVTVGRVDEAWRDDASGMWRFRGAIISTKEHAGAAIEGIIDGSGTGVSIDADAMAVDMEGFSEEAMAEAEAAGRQPTTWFSETRVAGLTIVPIPAFHEAYIGLGHEFEEDMSDEDRDAAEAALAACGCADAEFRDVSQGERDERADDGTAMPDGSYPIANESDLKNAIQAIGRAKNPDAVKAHIKKRARALGHPELIPENWSLLAQGGIVEGGKTALVGDQGGIEYIVPLSKSAPNAELLTKLAQQGTIFAPGTKDGPGWITNPVATKRIRDYWTRGEGAAKIRWGAPGDFTRCERQLRKYVQNPAWLAGLCANMHKEVNGYWPGDRRNRGRMALTASGTLPAPMMNLVPTDEATVAGLVAAAAVPVGGYPNEWFANPRFREVTPLTIDKASGRIYGHLAQWGVCHIGISGDCVKPPHSKSGYANFLKGIIDTDAGEQRVGCLTYGIGHADVRMRAAAATAHYDRMDAVVAYVNVGEDAYGIWYSGVLAPDVDEALVNKFRAVGAISGDWRPVGRYGLDLIASVAVNTPGYPVSIAASAGEVTAIVAAGMVLQPQHVEPEPETFADENQEYLAAAIAKAMDLREARAKNRQREMAARERALALRRADVRRRLEERS